ncbi:MAG: hypothetical protein K0B09_09680 [Bacteroidales bacterium]|nr:hypothetical protein [Bacteroidales bacterium]
MNKPVLLRGLLVLMISVAMWGCVDRDEYTFEVYKPVYKSYEDFRSSFKSGPGREIQQAGKIYFKDNFIFVNEVNKGIHVINNADPSNPQRIAFYEIEGNVDIAIRGNILFADSYIDLVSIDITDIENPLEVSRLENAFPEVLPPNELGLPIYELDRSKGVVVGWKVESLTQEYGGWGGWLGGWWGGQFMAMDGSGGGENNAGVAGSMARFMLHQHYLYSVTTPWVLKTLDISDAGTMTPVDSVYSWREMETLFRLDENLFVGTTSGMIIYDISDPAHPQFVSDINHINACDPVVVANDIAYVTLRSGTMCNNFTNQLDVIDISNIEQPRLLKSFPMFNPHGLGIDHPLLFICDGAAGLKVYDATNPLAISSNMIAHFPDIDTFDVIPLGGILILIGHDGLFQYDYSNPQNIMLLSHIPIRGK